MKEEEARALLEQNVIKGRAGGLRAFEASLVLESFDTLRQKLRGLEEERDEARANWTEEAAQVEWQARRAEGAEQKLRAAEELVREVYDLQAPLETPPQAHSFMWDDWCRRARIALQQEGEK